MIERLLSHLSSMMPREKITEKDICKALDFLRNECEVKSLVFHGVPDIEDFFNPANEDCAINGFLIFEVKTRVWAREIKKKLGAELLGKYRDSFPEDVLQAIESLLRHAIASSLEKQLREKVKII